ncbi:MAG: hypothetical protein KDI30_01420 [Pseudomonadales bacterium]|nr:hypothetical protein [Pseudomonadales bacterium]
MNIELSKQEYRRLLDILYLGQWMLSAHDNEDDPDKAAYDALIQKLYSHAAKFDCDPFIEHSEELDEFWPTRLYEDTSGVFEHVDNYNEETFWDELAHRLAQRDVNNALEQQGKTREDLGMEAYITLVTEFEEGYLDIFERYGLERVEV